MPFRLAVLAACAAVSVAAVAYAVSEARLERTYAVEPAALVVRSDAASLERGRHLVRVVGQCMHWPGIRNVTILSKFGPANAQLRGHIDQ